MARHEEICPGSGRQDGRVTLFGKIKCPICGALLDPIERSRRDRATPKEKEKQR
jgi:hypothetical protein